MGYSNRLERMFIMKKLKLILATLGALLIISAGQPANAEGVTETLPGIAPQSKLLRATPDIRTVTLKNGESFRLVKKVMSLPGMYPNLPLKDYVIVHSQSEEKEFWSLQVGEVVNNSFVNGKTYPMYTETVSFAGSIHYSLAAGSQGIFDYGIEITNYSTGEVTYKVGINIGLVTDDNDLYFNMW